MRFYVGTHHPSWLQYGDLDYFVSRRTLPHARFNWRAAGRWALDSGGYTELSQRGEWSISPERYAAEIALWTREIGAPDFAAGMDFMCEPSVRRRTGLTTHQHQHRTVDNFLRLRDLAGPVVMPVIQGWAGPDEYLRCAELYEQAGVDLRAEPVVGIGSICRRGQTQAITEIVATLRGLGLRLHAFGVRSTALAANAHRLVSADSMAWSYDGWKRPSVNHGGRPKNCANCRHHALTWYAKQLGLIESANTQLRTEDLVECAA